MDDLRTTHNIPIWLPCCTPLFVYIIDQRTFKVSISPFPDTFIRASDFIDLSITSFGCEQQFKCFLRPHARTDQDLA